MAQISRFPFVRHLRAESSVTVIHHRAGRRVGLGRGLSFWFMPLSASISEVPMDNRDQSILLHGRSEDFQDVAVQLALTWRVREPEALAERVDFSIDLSSGQWLKQPLEKIAELLGQLSQQITWDWLVKTPLARIMAEGVDALGERLRAGLSSEKLSALGIELVTVGVAGIRPAPEVEKALQTPAREHIQQEADKATFERRALAVERERAIAENELQNRIALAKREEQLISQQGANDRRKATEAAEAERIRVTAKAEQTRLEREAEAAGIAAVEGAKVAAERDRVSIYQEMAPELLLSLAARELAGNLPDIDTLNLSPDLLGPLFGRLAQAGARRLEAGA